MDLGLDSLLEAEIAKQTKVEDKVEAPAGEKQEQEQEQKSSWIDDVIREEKVQYPECKIELDEITAKTQTMLSMKCNLYIYELLQEWDDALAKRQEEENNDLLQETKMSLFPLLVQLRKNNLPHGQLVSVATILYHLQRNEWDLALQSYMQLSLGNVAWPIGVTSVGIHARSAHSKITGGDNQSVATVMLDDSTRKWTTSLKRLITVKKSLSS